MQPEACGKNGRRAKLCVQRHCAKRPRVKRRRVQRKFRATRFRTIPVQKPVKSDDQKTVKNPSPPLTAPGQKGMLKATGQRPGRFSFRPPFSAWGTRLTVAFFGGVPRFLRHWAMDSVGRPQAARRRPGGHGRGKDPPFKNPKTTKPRPAGDPVAGLRARSGSLPFPRQIFKNSAHRPGKAARIHIKKAHRPGDSFEKHTRPGGFFPKPYPSGGFLQALPFHLTSERRKK